MAELRVPPGRAGRLRLRRGLEVARRGADLLDRKLRVLRARHEELLRAEGEARERWHARLTEAESWLRRGLILGGEEALDETAVRRPAQLEVTWTSTMGVRHPRAATCAVPEPDPDEPAPANTALVHAEAGYADAVRAGAEYAAAAAAARAVGDELLATRRRVRALRRHWIPRLEAALARVDAGLEQNEHEDAVRRKWVADLQARGR
ncbi:MULTISPECIES: V-type ATP synthase subunit D [unclassified Streptomyces]|uniref:V-type ATP synthase subunit D n=1 Tax=unclassified Streptomyces TaxID=2593676 RepID=UPI000FB94A39|nr:MULTISPECIES: V-type ATP synthase subunit D [unclassified Streptomyces]MDH6447697.1 V/A-type H+-transporting ATPase subunit D [Streptomyces sp. SAI-119]MDH6501580.1 V/A-type H+-transporting ATPase subunit D [Streptomyces sp. SAI-149]